MDKTIIIEIDCEESNAARLEGEIQEILSTYGYMYGIDYSILAEGAVMNYSKMTLAEIDAEIEKIESEYDNAPAMLKCSLVWKHRDLYEAKAERWEEIALTATCAYENDDCDAGCPINPLECMITTQISSEFEQKILNESEEEKA